MRCLTHRYDCSAHFLWCGERTRQLDHAHVEFLRGIQNPIGVKVRAPRAATPRSPAPRPLHRSSPAAFPPPCWAAGAGPLAPLHLRVHLSPPALVLALLLSCARQVSDKMDPREIVSLIASLNPDNTPGRLSVIVRRPLFPARTQARSRAPAAGAAAGPPCDREGVSRADQVWWRM